MNEESYHVAIVGATGAVGAVLCQLLFERQFPMHQLTLLASERSLGKVIQIGEQEHAVQNLADFDFEGCDYVFFSAGKSVSEQYAPIAVDAGACVIDNTSAFRYDDDVPLIIPEVNIDVIADHPHAGIIANPNCSTIQMLVALKPLYDIAGIEAIHVATYQAVSGAGNKAVDTLARQTAALLNGEKIEQGVFPQQIAFNVLPHIDEFEDNGFTREEMKMVWETHKILGDSSIRVNPTAVRVPVFYGHSESIFVQLKQPLTPELACRVMQEAPGIIVAENPAVYPTAATHAVEQDAVFVGRVRQALDNPCGLHLWVVADNLRKGAALNAIQIAECRLRKSGLLH